MIKYLLTIVLLVSIIFACADTKYTKLLNVIYDEDTEQYIEIDNLSLSDSEEILYLLKFYSEDAYIGNDGYVYISKTLSSDIELIYNYLNRYRAGFNVMTRNLKIY